MCIPAFPLFKLLEISDRTEIESYTQKFQPYSDFHFTILWIWDIHEPVLLSVLNNNLIIFHADCLTTNSCYSVVGSDSITDTIGELSDYIVTVHGECPIKWLPEETFRKLNGCAQGFFEDRSSFDYIYDVKKLREASGSEFASYRSKINHFEKNYTDYKVSILDILNKTTQDILIGFFYKWMIARNAKSRQFNSGFELQAFRKLLYTIQHFKQVGALAIYANNQLQAFAIVDFMNTHYACIPFSKSNYSCKYASQFLMKEVVSFLYQKQILYINFEPDLGILSLRSSKQFYKPITYLKKYSLEARS
jgi:hypothetical protein